MIEAIRTGLPAGMELDEREVVHRWAHSMQDQARGTVYRYFLTGRRRWQARLR